MFDLISEFNLTPSEFYTDDFGHLIPNDGDEHYTYMGEWAEVVEGVLVKNYRG